MMEYRLKLPKQSKMFDDKDLIFIINHIRSRMPSVLYFIFHCYDISNTEILVDSQPVFTSDRRVIGSKYNDDGGDYVYEFSLTDSIVESTVYTQIEIRTIGIDSENPLYLSELMLQENDGTGYHGYHVPSEYIREHTIELPSSSYANLYDKDGNYLQVIRPNKEAFSTNVLGKAQYTILAPHFDDDEGVDSHVSVFLEAMNQTEQRIDVLR